MELFIKTDPDRTYSELIGCGVVDAHGNPITDAKIELDAISKFFKVVRGDQEMQVREGLYDLASQAGDVIKIDFNKSRARRIKPEAMAKIAAVPNSSAGDYTNFDPTSIEIETTRLKDVNFDPRLFEAIKTGTYLDKFISSKQGFMPGINVMVTGDPGVGKSSNLMDILVNVVKENPDRKVLYISAEMSEIDVEEFRQYYPGLEDIEFLYIGNYVTDPTLNIKPYQAMMSVLHKGYDLIVMDSIVEIQSMIQEDLGMSTKKGERWILDLMNKHNGGHNMRNIFSSFLCIQQMNKGGVYVGSKRLEHMTSAFLQLSWDKKEPGKRYMMFTKNRKGKEKVKLYYGFNKTDGIVYDEVRHQKEGEILERLQAPEAFGVEEATSIDFGDLFRDISQREEVAGI